MFIFYQSIRHLPLFCLLWLLIFKIEYNRLQENLLSFILFVVIQILTI